MSTLRVIRQRAMNSVLRGIHRRLNIKKHNLILACMPKSGSTYISRLLIEAAKLPEVDLANVTDWGEQYLSHNRLKQKAGAGPGLVCQIHLRASPSASRLIEKFNLTPIVLVRNIYDVVPSIADHWQNEKAIGFGSYAMQAFAASDREAIYDFIIANWLPWYLGFLCSWHNYSEHHQTHWLTYETFFSDQKTALKETLEYCGIPSSDTTIEQAIQERQSRWSRLNKGVSGRGDTLLLPRHKQAIQDLASTWATKHPRFGMIGLE